MVLNFLHKWEIGEGFDQFPSLCFIHVLENQNGVFFGNRDVKMLQK